MFSSVPEILNIGCESKNIKLEFDMEIHLQSNPNPNTSKESQDMILDIFWKESDHKTDPYRYCHGMIVHLDELNGNSDVWHHLYLLPFICFIVFLPDELPQKG